MADDERERDMDANRMLCEALEEKRKLFLDYEKNTTPLTECAAEDIEHYITKRSELAIEIDKVNEKIEKICKRDPQGALLLDATRNRCSFDALPPALHPLFQIAQEVMGIMNRIAVQEPGITGRMQTLLAEYRADIASTQNVPKIVRYLNGMQDTSAMNLLDGRDKA